MTASRTPSTADHAAPSARLGALIFPFMLMYMNSKLPRAARPRGWIYLVLVLNFLFFGFFFVNFVWNEVTGDALVQF
jgi:TRAP-type C4-dicarboxylate transport system permease small subunit